jgi:hypothetical protein
VVELLFDGSAATAVVIPTEACRSLEVIDNPRQIILPAESGHAKAGASHRSARLQRQQLPVAAVIIPQRRQKCAWNFLKRAFFFWTASDTA